MRSVELSFGAALLLIAGCGGGTKFIGSHPEDEDESAACAVPSAPPPELGFDAFYAKYLDANGIPVLSSAEVADRALERACETVVHLLEKRADVRARMAENGQRVAVIGRDQVITDLPEYSDLNSTAPETDWDRENRSLGATLDRPVSSGSEENLLCLPGDAFAGEFLLVHSVAHGLRRLGIGPVDPDWDVRLSAAYESALASGLWENTYAETAAEQYWAEGVQDWYDANRESARANGVHNHVNTRAELRAYDPTLAALIAEYLPDDDWRPACP